MAIEDDIKVRSEIARSRRSAGLSHAEVARACGLSRSAVARTEAGTRRATAVELACMGAAVGLDVRLRAYPAGDPMRDAGQLRLLERLRSEIERTLGWRTEVPLPAPGDLRAWDAVIDGRGWSLAVEAETVIDDVQALQRRLNLKRRDGGADRVVLLIADTPRNRRAVAATAGSFSDLPLTTRLILGPLRQGAQPASSGIVFL